MKRAFLILLSVLGLVIPFAACVKVPEVVLVVVGTFLMGENISTFKNKDRPAHSVELSSFIYQNMRLLRENMNF